MPRNKESQLPTIAEKIGAKIAKVFIDKVEEVADEVPKLIDFLENRHAGEIKDKNAKIQEIQQKNEQLKNFIYQERKKRGYSSSTRTNKKPNKPNPQDIQKINEQSSEIDSLKKQLTELQNQIKDLEKEKTSAPKPNPETNQKIENLQKQKENIKQQIQQKTSAKKQLESKVNSADSTPNNSGFNWMYVIIPGAILLVVMGIVIAYLVGKQSKK